MNYSFYKTGDKSLTLFNKDYKDFYHSKKGALKEALYQFLYPIKKFLKANNGFSFFEIGFGLGYNALVTSYFLEKIGKEYSYFSIEKDRKLFDFLLKNCQKFKIKDYCTFLKDFKEKIFFEDALSFDFEKLSKLRNKYLIIYHDAFSPSKNKELWTFFFFKKLKKSNFDFLLTFTSNPRVRVALFLNNYFVLPTFRIGGGSGTIAFKDLDYLDYLNFKNYSIKELVLLFSNYSTPYGLGSLENFPFKVKNKRIRILNSEFYKKLKKLKILDAKEFLLEIKKEVQEFWSEKISL